MTRLFRTLIVLVALGLVVIASKGDWLRRTATTSTTTSEPSISTCLATQFRGVWVDGSAGAGTAYAWITLTNSEATCVLPTWLNLTMGTDINSTADRFARVPDLAELTRPDGSPITKPDHGVTLATQETATVALSFTNRSGCDMATTVTISWLVGVSRQELPVPAAYLVTQCSGPSAFVSPVFR
ncbi:unannotated protein [freshwater metagenome]|uniref:Unannotated protein n=1 Tax=freshwater metagenome TaxID=449393 RepID=A0A6J7DNH5_9ZZZZ